MFRFPNPDTISPKEFEETVHSWFEHFPDELHDFDAEHLETHSGVDGDYEIDVTVRFSAFGGSEFLVLCECKKHTNPIERGLVQILNDKRRSMCAQKAIMVSTASFQSGAREYAEKNRIALIQITTGSYAYITNSVGGPPLIPDDADPYCGVLQLEMLDKFPFPMRLTSWDTHQLEKYLKMPIQHDDDSQEPVLE